jgi:hypothetical protein
MPCAAAHDGSHDFQMRLFGPQADFPADKRWLLGTRNNMFTLIDARDAAQAVEKGLSAAYDGAHALFVNDKVNTTGCDSEVLLDLFYPDVKARKRPLAGQRVAGQHRKGPNPDRVRTRVWVGSIKSRRCERRSQRQPSGIFHIFSQIWYSPSRPPWPSDSKVSCT